MKKLKLLAGMVVAALSLAVFVSANSNGSAVASSLTLSQVEAQAACTATEMCPAGEDPATCSTSAASSLCGTGITDEGKGIAFCLDMSSSDGADDDSDECSN